MKYPVRSTALALVLLILSFVSAQGVIASGGDPEQAPRTGSGPTRLTIPAIDLEAKVVPVSYQVSGESLEWRTVDDAVGWHRSSAMPGSPGNTVMSGHNASMGTGIFRDLHKVRKGDMIAVTVAGQEQTYVVTDRVVFRQLFASAKRRAKNAAWLGHFGDERLTLITCHPWFSNTHRLVIIAHPTGPIYRNYQLLH